MQNKKEKRKRKSFDNSWYHAKTEFSNAADIAFIMSSSQAIVNWLNALDQSDFS